jgi:hypothetical protein
MRYYVGIQLRSLKNERKPRSRLMSDAYFEEPMTHTNVSNVIRSSGASEQSLTSVSQFTKDFAELRDQAGLIKNDVARAHDSSLRRLLSSESDEKVKLGLKALLVELTEERGLGWSDIAKLTHVSIPAIRKWRTGGEITPTRLYGLAKLAAFLKILQQQDVSDPAAWLATPLSDEINRAITKAAIYADGYAVDLLAYADNHINLEELLRLAEVPADNRRQNTALVTAADGSLSIIPFRS